MSRPGDPHCTMRCGVCNLNWPFYQRFIECPVCDEECRALRFTDTEDILTIDEANEILRDHGLTPFRPKGVLTKEQITAHVITLHNDVDRWNAGEVPEWMK